MVLEVNKEVTVTQLVYDEVELNFRETLASGQGLRVTQNFRAGGKVTQVMFHFPGGCNALVSMRLMKDELPFYPIRGYMALNDATPIYYANAEYYPREPLTVEMVNADEDNPHTVSCSVVIRYTRPSWW